jgi:hypothetical protein
MASAAPTQQIRAPRGERGAAVLEAAFVAPIFLVLLLAVLEGGIAFYERLSVANMSLAGARSASGQGNDALADFNILQSVHNGSGGLAGGSITSIVVYRATGPEDTVPAACKSASVSGLCNRYVAADLAKDATQFGCTGPPGPSVKIDGSWCPSVRKSALSGPSGPPDYIGVYIETAHHDLTGILGNNITLRGDSIFRMEPRTLT